MLHSKFKRVLAVAFVAVALIATSLPLHAFATGTGAACVLTGNDKNIEFATVQEAINASEPGDTVTLLRDVTESIAINNQGDTTNLTLNLNGCTIASAGERILPDGTVKPASYAIGLFYGTSTDQGVTSSSAHVTIKNGKVLNNVEGSNHYGIANNGSYTGANLTLSNLTIEATHPTLSYACYLPAKGNYVINNCTIESRSVAVELRAGNLTVTDSTLTGGLGEPGIPGGNHSGTTSFNTALGISQHLTQHDINVTIEGSTLTGGAAIIEANPQNNANHNVSINVKSGTLNGLISSDCCTGFLNGGTYSVQPEAKYVAQGAGAYQTSAGTYVIETSHAWAAPVWSWSADNSKASCTIACTKCTTNSSGNAEIKSVVTKNPAVGVAGTRTLTATARFNGQSFSATKTVEIPALQQVATTPSDSVDTGTVTIPTQVQDSLMAKPEVAEALADGKTVSMVLAVNDATTAQINAASAAVNAAAGNLTVGKYLDLNLGVYADYDKIIDAANELNETITVNVSIANDAALVNVPAGYSRTYKVIRVHEGVATVLDATFDPATGELTFETNCFSTYAIAYEDAKVVTADATTSTGTTTQASATTAGDKALPQTSDAAVAASTLAALATSGCALAAGGVFLRRRTR
jgi:hypothetical protein